MEHYYTSSLSKKLMAMTTMLLITTTITAVTDQQLCGADQPVAYGPCKTDYARCVTNVITALQDKTTQNGYYLSTSSPAGYLIGGVKGEATCISTSYADDCRSCLSYAKQWLAYYCRGVSSGYYSYDVCSMSYQQIS
ncbi:hypothetical protein LINGRAHAP2_LOCUS34010 [Linum grandiflorum]